MEGDNIPSSSVIADGSVHKINDSVDDRTPKMPWSDAQEWALLENLPKYVIFVGARRYARWRTMSREVPELAGYPATFLRQMHRRGRSIAVEDEDRGAQGTLGLLPMIDDFEFLLEGGVVGRVYGLPGVADGSRIRTPSLVRAEQTVPLGYVTTNDDGLPFSDYSLVGTAQSAAMVPR